MSRINYFSKTTWVDNKNGEKKDFSLDGWFEGTSKEEMKKETISEMKKQAEELFGHSNISLVESEYE
ncbi:hypothetical protein [Yeosuana sp.]|uniref:hypothetical protein n=1 Tax=Yeosuana sp. TaxID=2529388 RepID=UPI00405505B4